MEYATANIILLTGGMIILVTGFFLGVPMALARQKSPRAPRYLFAAHLAAIIQGGLLLGLTVAADFSPVTALVEIIAAAMLVGGIALFDIGLIVNWLQGVKDAFKENSVGNKISSAGTPFVVLGACILLYGVGVGLFG